MCSVFKCNLRKKIRKMKSKEVMEFDSSPVYPEAVTGAGLGIIFILVLQNRSVLSCGSFCPHSNSFLGNCVREGGKVPSRGAWPWSKADLSTLLPSSPPHHLCVQLVGGPLPPPPPPPLHLGYRCVAVDFFLSPTQIGFTLAQIFQASSEQTTKKFSSVDRKWGQCTPLPQMLKPSHLSWGILGFPRHGVVQPLGDPGEQGSVRTPQVEKEVGTGHLVIPVLSAPTHPGGLEEGREPRAGFKQQVPPTSQDRGERTPPKMVQPKFSHQVQGLSW